MFKINLFGHRRFIVIILAFVVFTIGMLATDYSPMQIGGGIATFVSIYFTGDAVAKRKKYAEENS